MRILISLILSLCFAGAALSQARDTQMDKAAGNGRDLPVRINVGGNVRAQAVLIPRVDARRIFGNEIANNYAVVEVNVGNKSPDAALIIHGVYIDYSHWALSGITGSQAPEPADDVTRKNSDPFQRSTTPSHVASEEYRVVRGQLLDAQPWTARNLTMRLLTFAGNLAGAYAFSIKEEGIVRGLNAFSGVAVPGFRDVWPDGTIEQLNRVSDFGFRTNRVIPSQGGEVIVCFFPIDRFLTPGFKRLFLKSPALFFAPGQMLDDKTIQKDVVRVLGDDLGVDAARVGAGPGPRDVLNKLRGQLPCYMSIVEESRSGGGDGTLISQARRNVAEACLNQFGLVRDVDRDGKPTGALKLKDGSVTTQQGFASFVALDYLSQASLNTVSVTIDGVMTLDTTALAAKIDGVTFDDVAGCGGESMPCFWSDAVAGGVRTGTISGSYLTGGSVVIADANQLGITEVNTISDGSDDRHLRFSFKLTKGVTPGTLSFIVRKLKPGTNAALDSDPRAHPFSYQPAAPRVTGVGQRGDKLTVRGENFLDRAPLPLVVTLRPPSGPDLVLDSSKFGVKSSGEIELALPPEADTPGCWHLLVDTQTPLNQLPSNNTFVVNPSVESATLDGDEIIVAGSGLDAVDCGGAALGFSLLNGGKTFKLQRENNSTGTEVRFKLPANAGGADATWKVRARFGGKDLGDPVPLQVKAG